MTLYLAQASQPAGPVDVFMSNLPMWVLVGLMALDKGRPLLELMRRKNGGNPITVHATPAPTGDVPAWRSFERLEDFLEKQCELMDGHRAALVNVEKCLEALCKRLDDDKVLREQIVRQINERI